MSVWQIVALCAILLAFSTSVRNVAVHAAMCRLNGLAEDLRWGVVPRSLRLFGYKLPHRFDGLFADSFNVLELVFVQGFFKFL